MAEHDDNQVMSSLADIAVLQMAANRTKSENLQEDFTYRVSTGDADSTNVVFSSGASVINNDNLALYVQGDQQAGVDNSSPFQKQPITEHNSPTSTYQIGGSGDMQTQDLFTRTESFDGNNEAVHVYVTNQPSNNTDDTLKVVMTQQGEILGQSNIYSQQSDINTSNDVLTTSKGNTLTIPNAMPMSDVNIDVDKSSQAFTSPCMICSDKGSGYHYSVFSCEGCKEFFRVYIEILVTSLDSIQRICEAAGLMPVVFSCDGCRGFFKRTVQKNLYYTCKDENTNGCNINKFTRNNCQYCRFQKCLQMGMKREAVREDRSPGGKHRMKRKFDDISDSHGNGTTIVYEEQPMDRAEKFVECLVQAQPDLIPKYDGNIGLQNIGINELMQFGYAELKYIIDWAKRLPEFNALTLEDQMALLKSSFMELNVLRLSFRSKDLDGSIKFAEGFIVPVDVATGMGWGKELIHATIEFGMKLKELHLDVIEFCILNGIVLTYPDAVGVKDKASIHILQTQMIEALAHYIKKNYPDEPRRYGKLLLRLPSLRTVSAKAAERFLSLTLDGTIQLNELVFEMIN